MSDAKLDFALLKIAAFVDAYTAILIGPNSHMIKQGDDLFVLGIGATRIPEVNVPLVTPKARLEVTFAAGAYALAKSPAEIRTVETGMAELIRQVQGVSTQTTSVRRALTKDESLFIGDPSKSPIQVGDVVVRTQDLEQYLQYLARTL